MATERPESPAPTTRTLAIGVLNRPPHQSLRGNSLLEVLIDLAHSMGERAMLPHDRGHLLWTSEDGASRMLTSSMDRWTTAIVGDDGIDGPVMGFGEKVTAHVTSRADGTIAGAAAVDYMLQIWAPSLSTSWKAGDGRRVSEGDIIVEISGDSESILRMERSILNLLGQLSGIATNAAHWATIAPRQVAATRKTVWGMLDKWAVHLGGGLTHRLNKDDATMIKENDLAVSGEGGMQAIVQLLSTMDVADCGAFLELEVTNEKDAIVAASTWKQRQESESLPQLVLMLDNFGPERSKEMVGELTEMGLRDAVVLEASGNIVFADLEEWRECGVDVLSTSAINRGTAPLDISMLIDQ